MSQPTLEKSLNNLKNIVEELERGDLPLDKALKQFETGVKLARDCQKTLTTAEQKVLKLIEKEGELALSPFESDDDED